MANTIQINRAPVLTLWAAVVAERLGYEPLTALTLGRAVAGMNAQSKGRRLGIYGEGEGRAEGGQEQAATRRAELLGRAVPTVETEQGWRAAANGEPLDPAAVERYLQGKLGDKLPAVRAAMADLAASYTPADLAKQAYALYEKFRPQVAEGRRGWGAAGELDLDRIRALAGAEGD